MSGKRSPDDLALWQAVAKSVQPLKRDRVSPAAQPSVSSFRRPYSPRPVLDEQSVPMVQTDPSGLDARAKRRLSKGQISIDHRVDLHGLSQERAHALLRHTILTCYGRNIRMLLVITGKGGARFAQTDTGSAAYRRRADFHLEGGVLRQRVPQWLSEPDLAPYVQAFDTAAPPHGGHGALYVRLRRRRL